MRTLIESARRSLERFWRALDVLWWHSPMAAVFMRQATLDTLTADLVRCRLEIDARRGSPRFRREWDTQLRQLEWEHVRRLERAGRGRDPFVRRVLERGEDA